jgi:hypothetical protein
MDAAPDQFGVLVEQVTALPDQPFGNVAETLLHAADVLYFNDVSRSPERPVELRARMATRTMALRRWRYNYSPGDLSIDYDTGGVVAKILLNTHDPFLARAATSFQRSLTGWIRYSDPCARFRPEGRRASWRCPL